MNELDRARFDLELLLPYVNHLKRVVNQGLRIKRRAETLGGHEPGEPELCFPGEVGGHEITIFQAPLTDQQKLDKTREELRMIAESAKYDGQGQEI